MEEETTGQEPVNESEGQEPKDEGKQETFDAAYVKRLRDEAASWRRKAKDLEGKVTESEREKMTEAEKAKADRDAAIAQAKEAQEALRKARADAAISREAAKHQVDADLLGKLVSVDFDDDGNPTGIDAAISDLLVKHPYLKASGGVSLSSTNPQRKSALTMADIAKMSETEINARWTEVEAALKANRQA